MKKDKKLEEKFKKTEKGKKLYICNIISSVLFVLSVGLVLIVTFNEGNELTGWLVGLNILAFICVIIATLLCTAYYYTLQQYISDNKSDNKKKEK